MKTIAHIHDVYLGKDPNAIHNFRAFFRDVGLQLLCEQIKGDPPAGFDDIRCFEKESKVFAKIGSGSFKRITRPLYRMARDRYYGLALKEGGARVAHAHFGYIGADLTGLVERLNLPLVVTFYGVDVSRLVMQGRWIARYRRMFSLRGAFIVLCDEAKSRLVDIGCPADKIYVGNCFNDLSLYPYKRREPCGVARLLIAARFVEKKGYPILFKAFARLIGEGRNMRLTVIGYGSPEQKEALARQAELLGIKDKVVIIDTSSGQVDFASLFRQSLDNHDIFIMPSIRASDGDDEGGPSLALVDAQAAGLPVIATRFPGSERSVIDGQTGIYCEMGDPESLAEKIDSLVREPGLWNLLGERASRLVRELFDPEAEANRLLRIYDDVA